MYKILISAVVILFISAAMPLTAQASSTEGAEAQAKVVFYRAGESSKTRRINFDALVNGDKVKRLKYGKPVLAMVDAGDYELGMSIKGSPTLTVTLKPGQTYYVYAGLERMGQTTTPSLSIVEEHVALTQQPAIEVAI